MPEEISSQVLAMYFQDAREVLERAEARFTVNPYKARQSLLRVETIVRELYTESMVRSRLVEIQAETPR